MAIKEAIREVVSSHDLGRKWLEARRLQQRRRDWTRVNTKSFESTTLSVFTNIGPGDVIIAQQFCEEFELHCQTYGDPKLGRIVLNAGAWPLELRLPVGDHNIYWWWSMNRQDDWLERYLGGVSVQPDVIACLSAWCCRHSQALGAATLYLPLAAGGHFKPLNLPRRGIGYAGTKNHKDARQMEAIVGPFAESPDFEWATNLKGPGQVNEFYNRKSIVLGMTEKYQEQAGMVNNRVFEVLASGTPFIVHRHRALEEVLGRPFPYQSDSPERSKILACEIMNDFETHLSVFDQYRRTIEDKHLYSHRMKTLIDFLHER